MPKNLGGSIPQMVRNPEGAGIKRLFFSQREIALIKDKTCSPGYGYLAAGTVMGVNTAASAAGGKGELVPFVPVYGSVVAGTDSAKGVSYLLRDGAAKAATVYVSLEDSYKYKVGDELYIESSNTGSALLSCGAITAIIRTDPLVAEITVATTYTTTNATLARGCYVFTVSGGTPFSIAKFILDKDVDTGTGSDAAGALASIVVSNAILYTNSCINLTAAAITSLGIIQDGPHTILK